MSFEPNAQQALIVFSMLLGKTLAEREPTPSNCKPKEHREVLLEKKFLVKRVRDKVKPAMSPKAKTKSSKKIPTRGREYFVLTPKARDWALQNLFCRLPERGTRPKLIQTRLQEALMPILRSQWSEVERRLLPDRVDLTSQPRHAEPVDDEVTLESIQKQIRAAYLSLTNGRTKERVLLKDLRPRVPAVSADFDAAIQAMQTAQSVVLAGLDNVAERTPEVEAAAIYVGENPRHMVYLQG
jgi:hypothetical protein